MRLKRLVFFSNFFLNILQSFVIFYIFLAVSFMPFEETPRQSSRQNKRVHPQRFQEYCTDMEGQNPKTPSSNNVGSNATTPTPSTTVSTIVNEVSRTFDEKLLKMQDEFPKQMRIV